MVEKHVHSDTDERPENNNVKQDMLMNFFNFRNILIIAFILGVLIVIVSYLS